MDYSAINHSSLHCATIRNKRGEGKTYSACNSQQGFHRVGEIVTPSRASTSSELSSSHGKELPRTWLIHMCRWCAVEGCTRELGDSKGFMGQSKDPDRRSKVQLGNYRVRCSDAPAISNHVQE